MIITNMKKSLWEKRKKQESFGKEEIEKEGFIHASTIDQFEKVSKKFKDAKEKIVILVLDENQLEGLIFEDLKNKGEKYPHIYKEIPKAALVEVLDFRKDQEGTWIKNKELNKYKKTNPEK